MKTHLTQAIQIKNIFSTQYETRLSPKLSYKIFKLCKAIEEEEVFFNKSRQEIINKYAERDDEGQMASSKEGFVQIRESEKDIAQAELNELLEIEVDLPDTKFTLDELDSLRFSVQEMAAIECLLSLED